MTVEELAEAFRARAAAALLPDRRLPPGRRGPRAGDAAGGLARPGRLRGARVDADLALHDRHQPLPELLARPRPPSRCRRAACARADAACPSRSGSIPIRTRRRATRRARRSGSRSSSRCSGCRRASAPCSCCVTCSASGRAEVAEMLESVRSRRDQRAAPGARRRAAAGATRRRCRLARGARGRRALHGGVRGRRRRGRRRAADRRRAPHDAARTPLEYAGREAIARFLSTVPAGGQLEQVRLVATRANGQPAFGALPSTRRRPRIRGSWC